MRQRELRNRKVLQEKALEIAKLRRKFRLKLIFCCCINNKSKIDNSGLGKGGRGVDDIYLSGYLKTKYA